jgi:phage terminase large subunit-like protein
MNIELLEKINNILEKSKVKSKKKSKLLQSLVRKSEELLKEAEEEEAKAKEEEEEEAIKEILKEVDEPEAEPDSNEQGIIDAEDITDDLDSELQEQVLAKAFGFDPQILARIRAEYSDMTQFYAQYYNNPNDPEECRIRPDKFQYYERSFLKNINDRWWINDQPLSVFAGIDFAFSTKRKADYTALAVVGIDPSNNYYVLEIIRFKSDRIADYFDAIAQAYRKWGFRKIRCEVTVAQAVIVRDLKENYIKPQGLSLIVDEHRPTRNEGSKEERIASTLEPKYDNLQVWHYKGGNIQALEEELILQKPPHDDCKDALTAAMDICVAPMKTKATPTRSSTNVIYHNRFGGVRYA